MNPNIDRIASRLTNSPDILSEGLYGFMTVLKDTPIDKLIHTVDTGYMDFIIDDPKFLALAQKIYASYNQPLPSSPQEWSVAIDNSTQPAELKSKLKNLIHADTANINQPSKVKDLIPGIIRFKRGTLIMADHVGYSSGGWRARQKGISFPYLLIGIGFLMTRNPNQRNYTGQTDIKNCLHPEFWDITTIQATSWLSEIHSSPKFDKILTARIDNITSIDREDPLTWLKNHKIIT